MLTTWSCLREGVDAFARRFPLLMGAWLVILAGQQLIDLAIPDAYSLYEIPAALVLLAPLYAGQFLLALRAVQDQPVSFREFFHGFYQWAPLVGVSLLVSLLVAAGFFMLIIPGIVWSLTFAFAPVIILDSQRGGGPYAKVGVIQAIQRSKELTKGYRGILFGVSLLLVLPAIAIAILMIAVPGFPSWAIELLALLSGTLFIGPVSATSYMVAYDNATRLRESA